MIAWTVPLRMHFKSRARLLVVLPFLGGFSGCVRFYFGFSFAWVGDGDGVMFVLRG